MKKLTIPQAALEVLKQAGKPMTAAEITQDILDKGLFIFNSKDPRGMVRKALEIHSEGSTRKDAKRVGMFAKTSDGKYSAIKG